MLNIVIIDENALNQGDLNWDILNSFGRVTLYSHSTREQGIDRLQNAHIVIANKYVIDEAVLTQLPLLRCICVSATGYNNIDIDAASSRNIVVCNVSGYSTPSTAQHTIALLLELTNQCGDYHQSVAAGDWTRSASWTYTRRPVLELSGLTLGIIGIGTIGQQVACVASALGMNVIAYRRTPSDPIANVSLVELDKLYQCSDIISLHCPLNIDSDQMINQASLSKMKKSALLINTARGGLINEADLQNALKHGTIAGAALDVLQGEPPESGHPLLGLANCILTPHIAWGSFASRKRLLDMTMDNVKAFIQGAPQNQVN